MSSLVISCSISNGVGALLLSEVDNSWEEAEIAPKLRRFRMERREDNMVDGEVY